MLNRNIIFASMQTQNNLLCQDYKNRSKILRKIHSYRCFHLSSVKLLSEFAFPGYLFKVKANDAEMRYDIYLRQYKNDIYIDLKEVDRFRKFFGSGMHIIILTETQENEF